MSRRATARARLDVPAASAAALWADVSRWPSFVEGFKATVQRSPDWPATGAKLVWDSIPGGRGRVTERVLEHVPGERLVTEVFEDQLAGTQTIAFRDLPDGGGVVEAALDYELERGGPLRSLADLLFIRRALSDALGRTLRRFAVEAADEPPAG